MEINKIYEGNSLKVLKTFPENSIDTVITDPPYGLSEHNEKTIREVLSKWLGGEEDYIPPKKGFLGEEWDAFVPPPALWKEVYRVMKPGATLLAFAGARTYDLMTIALRLAGFEVKDSLMWLYGSGFPKAQAIDLMIDKRLGVEDKREAINKINSHFHLPFFPNSKDNAGATPIAYQSGTNADEFYQITAPASMEAKQWWGIKTHALRPAYEPIIMAMKPNEGSYVDNALKWQIAGLNIDEARIEYHGIVKYATRARPPTKLWNWGHKKVGVLATPSEKGRYPANVIIDEEVGKMIDDQVPNTSRGHWAKTKITGYGTFGGGTQEYYGKGKYGDKGGASRFFYCAKASEKERKEGLEGNLKNHHPTVKPIALLRYLVKLTKMPNPNQIYLDPFIGTGTTAIACYLEGRNWIGIELNHEYVEIANARIKYWNAQKKL